jgi:hypothetical protein
MRVVRIKSLPMRYGHHVRLGVVRNGGLLEYDAPTIKYTGFAVLICLQRA